MPSFMEHPFVILVIYAVLMAAFVIYGLAANPDGRKALRIITTIASIHPEAILEEDCATGLQSLRWPIRLTNEIGEALLILQACKDDGWIIHLSLVAKKLPTKSHRLQDWCWNAARTPLDATYVPSEIEAVLSITAELKLLLDPAVLRVAKSAHELCLIYSNDHGWLVEQKSSQTA